MSPWREEQTAVVLGTQAITPACGKWRQENCCKFEVSLVGRMLAWPTGNPEAHIQHYRKSARIPAARTRKFQGVKVILHHTGNLRPVWVTGDPIPNK